MIIFLKINNAAFQNIEIICFQLIIHLSTQTKLEI